MRADVQAPGSAIFSEQAWQEVARSLGLSGREVQIVRGVFDEHVESAIASDLGISGRTVHTHLERLHRKLGVTTRTGLVLRLIRQFLALAASSTKASPPSSARFTTRTTVWCSPGRYEAGEGGVSAK